MSLLLFCLLPLTAAVLHGYSNSPDVAPTLHIVVRFPGGHRHVCGGVAVSRQLVLTSKHCLYREGARAMEIQVNSGDRSSPIRSNWFMEMPESVIVSEIKYQGESHEINNDLALLPIRPALSFCSLQQPKIAQLPITTGYEIPIQDEELEGAFCSAAGWGINEKNEFSRQPMTAFVHLHYEEHGYERPVLVATYHSPSTRFCAGDSGSPVFCWLRGSPYLVGLLSEIGGGPQKDRTMTMAEECSQQRDVLITDVRYRLAEISVMFPGQLMDGQRLCGFI